ncbi:MAG: RidA family protein [Lachnospiraceae bacterium]|nr:RidA family protein [Lachnospiraceae bacterium]
MGRIEDKLKEMGFELPVLGKPGGAFVPAQKAGNLIFVSGNTSVIKDGPSCVGCVGRDVTTQEAYKGAQLAMLRCLASLKTVADLDDLRIVKLTGFVYATPDFKEHPAVMNGASEMVNELYGEDGAHARCAIGLVSLPGGSSVEIEVIAEIKER